MKSLGERYNFVAGQNLERLCAISDGVFAVAMTLLVLDLHVPAEAAIHSEGDLWRALVTTQLFEPGRLALYALGAAFCAINTYWSIAFIVTLQINYAIAPRIKPLSQL